MANPKYLLNRTGAEVDNILSSAESHVVDDSKHITSEERSKWNAKSDFSGSYNDLSDKPTIPTKTSDLTNDSNFATEEYVQENTPQSDWNQNDNTAVDYVKNRTHYVKSMTKSTMVDGTLAFGQYQGDIYAGMQPDFTETFKDGQEYIVTFDDTEFDCIAYTVSSIVVVGNAAIAGLEGGNNEPFAMNVNNNSLLIATLSTDSSHIVKIEHVTSSDIKKLDQKYIPDVFLSKTNPTGTGSFSLNRKADTTVGDYSFAEGYGTTASGFNSHAEGHNTTASGQYSHAEGHNTTASSRYSHAEGYGTTASGDNSHAEGNNTTASGYYSHAEGLDTIASSNYQHVQGQYNIEDLSNTYADIIGKGIDIYNRSNISTIDWSGNAWYAGNVYVGSTSGKNKDEGSKKLATEDYVLSLKPTITTTTLSASSWDSATKTYSFETKYPYATYDLEIALDSTATAEQAEAFNGAQIVGSATSNIIKAYGELPTVDIPIIIKVVNK